MPALFAPSLWIHVLAADPAPPPHSIWEMLMKGGWTMIPLGACSLVALTIVIDRVITTRRAKVAPTALAESLRGWRSDPGSALARCQSDPSPLASVAAAVIRSRHLTADAQEKHVSDAGQREVQRLKKRLRILSAMPQAATMLGLLGTVLGMIRTFTVIAASGESLGKTERLAQGIYEAWTATAAGLAIAIPTLIAYHLILGRVDAAASALDEAAVGLLSPPDTARTAPSGSTTPDGALAVVQA